MKKKLAYLVASFFGVGFSPKASGTVGSLCALPFIALCINYGGFVWLLVFTIGTFLFGTLASHEVLKYTKHDPALIVIDEVAGQSLTFLFFTELLAKHTDVWWIYLVGFGLFRLFDILKPWPVSWADEKLENAFGVMFDDILAGLYAAVCLFIVILVFI